MCDRAFIHRFIFPDAWNRLGALAGTRRRLATAAHRTVRGILLAGDELACAAAATRQLQNAGVEETRECPGAREAQHDIAAVTLAMFEIKLITLRQRVEMRTA